MINVGGMSGPGPGLQVHRVQQQQSGGVVVQNQSRLSLPATLGNNNNNAVPARRQAPPGGKSMRLRCRFRPLHDSYHDYNGKIVEDDTDVIFVCGDGHQVRGHRVIMASSSKFFATLFKDQTGEISVVNIPDIKVDIMKLILQLTYRDRVYLTMGQIKQVGEFITMFGMAWSQFGFEEHKGEEQMTAMPMPPTQPKPIELPRKVVYVTTRQASSSPQAVAAGGGPQQQQQVRRVMANIKRQQQQQQQQAVINQGEEEYNGEMKMYGNGQQQPQVNGQVERPTNHSRKSRLTPRAGTEMEDNEMMKILDVKIRKKGSG